VQAPEPASPPSPPAAETAAAPAGQPASEQTAPTGEAAAEAPEQVGSVDQAEQAELPGAGTILVSRRPIEVLASPSSSAPSLYGFPAGRPFRVIGHEAGFAHIQDLRSKASGWIDEAALAPPPNAPAVSAPSQPKAFPPKQKPATSTPSQSAGQKPTNPSAAAKAKSAKSGNAVAADSETGTPPDAEAELQPDRRRTGLFGRGGLLGGIFGGGN
jgi:hypothetical protein